jgi:glycine cleavage system H lipoate-binding protein
MAGPIVTLYYRRMETKQPVNREYKRIVEAGGGEYVTGMLGSLVLFNSPQTGSTLALPENLLTSEAVKSRILASNKAFESFKLG